MIMTDEELIYNIHLGRREALELLFFRYEKKMRFLVEKYRFIFRAIGYDNEDIRGLLHQSVCSAVAGYRFTEGCFFNYHFSVVRCLFMDVFRSGSHAYEIKKNTIAFEEDEFTLEDIVPDKDGNIASSYDMNEFLLRMDGLSALEKEVLLQSIQGFSREELASLFHITPKKVSNTLQHARGKLKKRLE